MVRVSIDGDRVVLEVDGVDRDLTRRNRLEIPLAHIVSARVDAQPATNWFRGFRIAGADVPQMLRPGLFYRDGDVVYWDVRNPERTIVLALEQEPYAQLVIEVADREDAAAAINAATA